MTLLLLRWSSPPISNHFLLAFEMTLAEDDAHAQVDLQSVAGLSPSGAEDVKPQQNPKVCTCRKC